jgi:hypothetical protein
MMIILGTSVLDQNAQNIDVDDAVFEALVRGVISRNMQFSEVICN